MPRPIVYTQRPRTETWGEQPFSNGRDDVASPTRHRHDHSEINYIVRAPKGFPTGSSNHSPRNASLPSNAKIAPLKKGDAGKLGVLDRQATHVKNMVLNGKSFNSIMDYWGTQADNKGRSFKNSVKEALTEYFQNKYSIQTSEEGGHESQSYNHYYPESPVSPIGRSDQSRSSYYGISSEGNSRSGSGSIFNKVSDKHVEEIRRLIVNLGWGEQDITAHLNLDYSYATAKAAAHEILNGAGQNRSSINPSLDDRHQTYKGEPVVEIKPRFSTVDPDENIGYQNPSSNKRSSRQEAGRNRPLFTSSKSTRDGGYESKNRYGELPRKDNRSYPPKPPVNNGSSQRPPVSNDGGSYRPPPRANTDGFDKWGDPIRDSAKEAFNKYVKVFESIDEKLGTEFASEARSGDAERIRKAYQKAVLKIHPDKVSDEREKGWRTDFFDKLNKAREIVNGDK
jgi:hypothetical protein